SGVIRGVGAGVVAVSAPPAGRVTERKLATLAQELAVEPPPVRACQAGRVDKCRKECMRGHGLKYMERSPYGTWRSVISAADLARSAVSLGYVQVAGGAPYWLESRPAEGGRYVI